jgi:N-acetylglucosamine malate deacetylase 2
MSSLLAIFAHPDDETFRCGGTLALLAQRGVKVHLLTLTHGEAGSCGEPALCTSNDLSDVRERELNCACAALGILPPCLMDYPDGHLDEADPERIIEEILAVIRQVQSQVLLSFGPDGLSGHTDHIAVGQMTLEAFHRAEDIAALYTVAVPYSLAAQLGMNQTHPVPDHTIALTVDVLSIWEMKQAAMHCHATQISSSPMVSAPKERQQLFFGREHFVRAARRDTNPDFLPVILADYIL